MGMQSIMVAVLASMLLSMAVFGFIGSQNNSTETVSAQAENEQSVNVANSGVNLAISTLRKNKNWRDGFNNLAMSGGRCTLTVTSLGPDTVRIISQGAYNGDTSTAIVKAKLSSIFPLVESALTVYGDSVNFTNDGKAFLVDGKDYKIDGTPGTHTPVYGMGVTSTPVQSTIKYQAEAGKVAANFQGKGSAPSVGTFDPSIGISQLRDQYRDLATIKLPSGSYSGNTTFGTPSSPQIVYVPGNLDWSGNISGAGILVVDGALKMSGNISWKGIILAVSGDVKLELGGSGNPHLLGTTFVGNSNAKNITNIAINGNPEIKYSYDTIQTIMANLDMLLVEIIDYWE